MRIIQLFTISLFVLLSLTACREGTAKDEPKIISGEIGGKVYYVAEPYFVAPARALQDNGIYVRAQYPNFNPFFIPPKEIYARNLQESKLLMSAKYYENFPSTRNNRLQEKASFFKADKLVGEEYGLFYYTQYPDQNQDHDDIWIEKENDEYKSFIACSDKISEFSVPQCGHNFYFGNFSVNISYNKKLLPHWKEIHDLAYRFLQSTQSEEKAFQFYTNSLQPNNSSNE